MLDRGGLRNDSEVIRPGANAAAEGHPPVTSDDPDGNIGFPSNAEGIDHLLTMLRKTAIRLTTDDIAGIQQALTDER